MADWKEAQETMPVLEPEHWVMHFDGSKLLHGSGAGVTLKSPKGDELSYVLHIHFPTTNNIAEYEALLHGVRGDDLWGMPRAELFASWCPRSLHGSKTRRPAPPRGPAVTTAGWRFHRGRLEPGDEDKSPPTAVLLKVGLPRQEQQRPRTGVTSATTKSSQSATKDPSPR
jgi:hypothetical protein